MGWSSELGHRKQMQPPDKMLPGAREELPVELGKEAGGVVKVVAKAPPRRAQSGNDVPMLE